MADPQQAGHKVIVGIRPFATATMYVSLIYNISQAKTKAKKRYLRAKKERRKQRKISTGDSILPEGETGDNPEDAPPGKTSTVIDLIEPTEHSRFVVEDDSRERKKRKLDHSIEEGSAEDNQPRPVEVDGPNPVDEPGSNHSLPLFPLPTRPDAPSKIELALQGLDKAQIEAELVDPSSTLSIDLDADDDRSALGLKTRKRLIDLGINELFAGIFHSSVRWVPSVAKGEQFRRPLSRFCSDPDTSTPVFMTHITHRGTYAFRPRLAAGRRSHTHCQ
jgi:ATP-dependent RNA helicase DDX51/DBP6